MPSVAEALRLHAPRYLERLRNSNRGIAIQKAFTAIMRCRTGELGNVQWQCTRCHREHWVGRSCGNRHCPTCGHEKTHAWIEKLSHKLLPGVHHFLITFTVPQELRGVLRAYPRQGYEALFQASSQALRDVAAVTKDLKQTQLGFFGVLHTWGRDPMVYHPHVHYVVAGGGVVLDAQAKPIAWRQTPRNFFVHHRTLIRVYQAKLRDALRSAGLDKRVPSHVWKQKFVVDIQPVDDGRSTIAYLAPYVHRVAINDHRIKHVDDDSVTYQYRPKKSRAPLSRTVSGQEFVRGFAQHILPTGFRKVRHFGWMASRSRAKVEELRMLVWFSLGWIYWLGTALMPKPQHQKFPAPRCAECGGDMRVVAIIEAADHHSFSLGEHAVPYLESG